VLSTRRCETNGSITVARVGNERGLADRRVTVSAYIAKKRQIADRGILTAASVGGERRNTKSGIVTIANLRALCAARSRLTQPLSPVAAATITMRLFILLPSV
jgi:hypothetical protein